jgi:hypothetical protein
VKARTSGVRAYVWEIIFREEAFVGHEVIRSPRSYRSMEEAYTHGSVALAQVRAQRAPASLD